MGEIVGAGLLAHVPTIVLPEETRLELNGGKEITLVTGLHQLRKDVFERDDYDTVVVLDSHWATTVEFVVTAQQRRAGLFTSEELPRGMCRMPYDFPGDPELAHNIEKFADKHGTWITAIEDEYLPIYYATTNLWKFLGEGLPDKRWVTIGVCQTGDMEDHLRLGRALGRRHRRHPRPPGPGHRLRRASHTFWPLRELRDHESSDPAHIFTPEAREADYERIAWFKEGRHDKVLDTMPEFWKYKPEAKFFHYLMMAGALGEQALRRQGPPVRRVRELHRHRPGPPVVRPPGRRLDRHRPARRPRRPHTPAPAVSRSTAMPEYRRILLDGAAVQVTVDGDELVAGDGRRVKTEEAQHLPPVVPSKVIAVHLNHRSRVDEFEIDLPDTPTYFHKPTSALNSPQGRHRPPRGLQVAQLRGRGRHRHRKDRAQHPPGRSGRVHRRIHRSPTTTACTTSATPTPARCSGSRAPTPSARSAPAWSPTGTSTASSLRTYVNGEVVQDGSTDEMKWDMHYLVADIARTITLYPGDVLLSGTPANSRPVQPGDVVEVEVEGLGRLTNHIVTGPTPIRTDVGAQPTESEEVLSTALGGDWEFRGIRPPRSGDALGGRAGPRRSG